MSPQIILPATPGQKKLYKYILLSEAKVADKLLTLDRMLDVYRSADDQKFIKLIRDAAMSSGEIVGHEFLIKSQFHVDLDVLEGETHLSTAEAHATLIEEADFQERRRSSDELMAVARHLIDCKDPEECAAGRCPVVQGNPMTTLGQIEVRLSGGVKDSKPLSFREIYERRKSRSLGARTFVHPFDVKIQGLEPGTLSVVAGWTGSYKTTFGLNMVHGNAVKHGYNCVFITSEVPKDILYLYLLCRHSYEEKFSHHGPVHRLDTQKALLSPAEEKFLAEEVEPDLMGNPDYGKILILDEKDFRSFTQAGIKAKLLDLGWDVDILVYDYIQLVKFMEDSIKIVKLLPVNPVNYYVRVFADLAMHLYGGRHQLHSVLLSQINRQGWKDACENEGEYELTALAEANELEKSAYYVMALFSNEDLKESGELKAQLLKHRGGETQVSSVLVPLDSRYLAIGTGIEGFGEAESSDMSGLLMSGGTMFGGF